MVVKWATHATELILQPIFAVVIKQITVIVKWNEYYDH